MSSKTITFDFSFTYSRGGNFDEANSVTVCEPNWEKRHVYMTMRGYLGDAERLMARAFADMPPEVQAARREAARAASAAIEAAKELGNADTPKPAAVEEDLLEHMRLALGPEVFSRAYDYMIKQLTGTKSLAFVGEDFENRIPLNEGVWISIGNIGGMPAVDKILSGWLSFFSGESNLKAREDATSGSNTPSTSPSSPAAGSRRAKH